MIPGLLGPGSSGGQRGLSLQVPVSNGGFPSCIAGQTSCDRSNATLPTNFVLENIVVIFHDAEYLLMFF